MGEYDGIQEREAGKSRMPLGMAVLFIGLILFGIVYIYLFMPSTTGWTQAGQYQRRIEARKAAVITHEVQEVAAGAAEGTKADQGPAIYKADCAMCHGENLEGGIGPALTGPTFLYGGTLADHVRVISEGTPKGMPGFGKQLGPEKVRAVAHYILFKHTK
jgi:cytochrome c oxidase cbb3-type subunit 3